MFVEIKGQAKVELHHPLQKIKQEKHTKQSKVPQEPQFALNLLQDLSSGFIYRMQSTMTQVILSNS